MILDDDTVIIITKKKAFIQPDAIYLILKQTIIVDNDVMLVVL